ncbi:unnamed protein product [Gordionus sp. m RMFG-2023]|uniref:uncharacterized protein LOC135924833 n=1 Tax=Gordionus sp. m RMFG-2023 TaxID=3053472 RepID=UPI0030E58CAB
MSDKDLQETDNSNTPVLKFPWPVYNPYFVIKKHKKDVNSIVVECKLCLPKKNHLSISLSSTSNIKKHLKRKHYSTFIILDKKSRCTSLLPYINKKSNECTSISPYHVKDGLSSNEFFDSVKPENLPNKVLSGNLENLSLTNSVIAEQYNNNNFSSLITEISRGNLLEESEKNKTEILQANDQDPTKHLALYISTEIATLPTEHAEKFRLWLLNHFYLGMHTMRKCIQNNTDFDDFL